MRRKNSCAAEWSASALNCNIGTTQRKSDPYSRLSFFNKSNRKDQGDSCDVSSRFLRPRCTDGKQLIY